MTRVGGLSPEPASLASTTTNTHDYRPGAQIQQAVGLQKRVITGGGQHPRALL